MLSFRNVAFAVTFLVFIGASTSLGAQTSYDLRVAYYGSKKFALNVDDILEKALAILKTLTPSINLVSWKTSDKEVDDRIIWAAVSYELFYETDANIFVVFLGENESKPGNVDVKVCTNSSTIFLKQKSKSTPDVLAKHLAKRIAKKLMSPTNQCGKGLFDSKNAAFSTCTSSAFQNYINSFGQGNFCLARESYKLDLTFYVAKRYQQVDDTKPWLISIVKEWLPRIKKAFATLNPPIHVTTTAKSVEFDMITNADDGYEAFRTDLEEGRPNKVNIVVLTNFEFVNKKVKEYMARVYPGGSVCAEDKRRKAVRVVMGTTKKKVEESYKDTVLAIAEKLDIEGIASPFNWNVNSKACQGLVEGNGEGFSSCSSKDMQDFIQSYKGEHGGVFCLPSS